MIEMQNVSRYYGRKVGVQELTCTVPRGQILGLLGPNGAGKTTVLRMLTGYLTPSTGQVRVGGLDIWEHPQAGRRLIGYLPDRPPLYREMTARSYLCFCAELRGVPARQRRARVEAVLEQLELTQVAGRPVGHLSRGFQQRLGLGQAIIHDPPVLVLDEPTVGLDPRQIHAVREQIRRLGRERTVVLSSHILPEVQALCHRVLIMDRGRVLAEDTPAGLAAALGAGQAYRIQIQGPPDQAEALLRSLPEVCQLAATGAGWLLQTRPGCEVRPELFRRLAAAGMPLLELTPVHPTLEEVFLRLTTREEGSPV